MNELIHSIYNEDVDELDQLLDLYPDLVNQYIDKDGNTPLTLVCSMKGDVGIIVVLLAHHANVNIPQRITGNSPLMLLFMSNYVCVDCIKLLLNHGADPNIQNKDGLTSLFYTIKNYDYNMTKLLLDNEADPNIVDNDGRNCLMYYRGNNINIIELLIKGGINVFHKDSKDHDILHFIVDPVIRDYLKNYQKTIIIMCASNRSTIKSRNMTNTSGRPFLTHDLMGMFMKTYYPHRSHS